MSTIQQTQDAIKQLIECGLDRKSFRVRCERLTRKGKFIGYGDAIITLLSPVECNKPYIPDLVKKFNIEVIYVDGDLKHIHVKKGTGYARWDV